MDDTENLRGLIVTQQETVDLVQCVNSCALNELRSTRSRYTWWNQRIKEDYIFKKLDRVFGNNDPMQILPNFEVHHLIRQGSDHAP